MQSPSRSIQLALATLAATTLIAAPNAPHVRAAESGGDPIFTVGESGDLDPIAVRKGGAFIAPGSNDGGPSQGLQNAAAAALTSAGNRVHVIFGGRVIATVATTEDPRRGTHITVPPSLHLGGHVLALASTLGGYATSPRRAPTADERRRALGTAAATLNTTVSRLTVRNLTTIDLGRGTAFVGTVDLRGTSTPRTDKRLFFVDELVSPGTIVQSLHNVMTIKVTEPLLEEPAEYLVDAIDLGNNTPALVTNIVGYDASTFAIYTRSKAGRSWKNIYTGGGAAM